MRYLLIALMICGGWATRAAAAESPVKPNVIFILADDLAIGDLGSYGQKKIKTPALDRMAAEGMRFTQAYAGTSVCAPSRAAYMTGLHTGHCPIRANRRIAKEGQFPLTAEQYTVGQFFKERGYATAAIGKWSMGFFDTTGSPLKKGFDHFFGYNCQTHAHNYFPTHLHRNDQRIDLDGKTYAQNLIADETLSWVAANSNKPFYLYYPVTLPHGKFEIDDLGPYAAMEGWTEQQKIYAAMVSRLDTDVGRLMDKLRDLKIADRTMIVFIGDNGSAFAPDSANGRFFDQSCGLRGFKRSMYEGGLRQAALAWWPGTVPAGKVSDEPWAIWDLLPTYSEMLAAPLPAGVRTDGLSILPLLKGGRAPQRECFYWELHEGKAGFVQAVRFGDIKAVRNGIGAKIEIYDLAKDLGESKDLAATQPDLVSRADALMKREHVPDPNWPVGQKKGKKSADE